MGTAKIRRVNEAIREILGDAITTELKNPRIGVVTVTDVATSPVLRAARVAVSVLPSAGAPGAAVEGLRSSHGVLQSKIASGMLMKRTPTRTFEYDDTVEGRDRITRLLEDE